MEVRKERKKWNEKIQQKSGSTIYGVLYGQWSGNLFGNWRNLCKRQLKFLLLFSFGCLLLRFRRFADTTLFLCVRSKLSNCNAKTVKERNDYENVPAQKIWLLGVFFGRISGVGGVAFFFKHTLDEIKVSVTKQCTSLCQKDGIDSVAHCKTQNGE